MKNNHMVSHYVMSYTRTGDTELSDSMHLGYSEEGITYIPLHHNTGILFPKADFGENPDNSIAGTTKRMLTPYLFRMEDGKIGVVAVRTDNMGDKKAKGSILLFTTKNLTDYEEHGLVSMNTELSVSNPYCEYDSTEKLYRITWKGSDGKWYENKTVDFRIISNPLEISKRAEISIDTLISKAIPVNVLPITEKEAIHVKSKLLPVENICVKRRDNIFVTSIGKELAASELNAYLTVKYSDGSIRDKQIIWDEDSLKAVRYDIEGQYPITGKVKLTDYKPLLEGRADPYIYKYRNKYYFISTDDNSGQKFIYIREGRTPEELFRAKDYLLMSGGRLRWAPELHEIDGKLYMFLALGDENAKTQWKTVQSHIMELKDDGNPIKNDDWNEPVRVRRSDGSFLYESGITLDMTYFEAGGISYVVWAQREISDEKGFGTSDLYLATVEKANPYQLTCEPVCILRPQFGWDRIESTVDEGPYTIQKNGKVFMTFSGSGVGNRYCVGLLTADLLSDLTNPSNWIETGYPVLEAESMEGELGPGHSSFITDEDGNDLLVFHMKPDGKKRSAAARRVYWTSDGTPVLDMTTDREVKEEYRSVKGKIVVVESGI